MQGSKAYLYLLAGVGALGGLLFGYDTAVISGAIDFLTRHFALNPDQAGWAAGCVLIGCMIGCLVGGPLADWCGRKPMLIASALLFAASGAATALAQGFEAYWIARIFGGIAIGAVSVISPLYIAEVAPGRLRGQMVTLYQLAIVTGILVVFFVNYYIQGLGAVAWNVAFGWRWMFGSLCIPAALMVALTFVIPESPRWLIKMGQRERALSILTLVDGADRSKQVLAEVERSLQEERGSISELFTTKYSRATMIGVVLAMACQFSGINAIMYFAPEIFNASGSGLHSAFQQTVLVGVVNLAFTFVAIWLIDRCGRRPLLIAGSAVQVLALGLVGLALQKHLPSMFLLIPILAYIGAFASGMGPVPWVVISEIFPTRIRGSAMAIATMVLWGSDFVVTKTFPLLKADLGMAKTFWIYGICSLAGLIFVLTQVPETKGRTLEQVEELWHGSSETKAEPAESVS